MKNYPLPPTSVPLDWEQEMARLVGFQEESTSNGKADYQPENSEPSLAEAEEPDQVGTEQPMWSNPFAKAGVVGATTLVGVSVAGLFLSSIMGGQKQAPTNTNNVVSSQPLRSQATSEPREQPLEKQIEDLKTELALSRQEEEVIQAQQKLKNSSPTPERVVQPTLTPQPQPREAITRTPEPRNPAPPTRIVQVVRPTITPQPQAQVANTRTPPPQITSGYYYQPPNPIPVVPRIAQPQAPISLPPSTPSSSTIDRSQPPYVPQIASSSSTYRPSIPPTINVPTLPPPPPVITPPTATTSQPKPNAAEQWATLAKLGSYGQVSATANQPRTQASTTPSRPTPQPSPTARPSTPPSTTASRPSQPPSTTAQASTQASAPASNVQEFSARPNPQVSTTPTPNPQVSTTPRPNPQVSTTPTPNPQVSTTPTPNPQVSTTPRTQTTVNNTNPTNNSNSTNNQPSTPVNPTVSTANQSTGGKALVLGSRAKGELVTAIYGEQSTSTGNNKSISVVRLTQPLKAADGAIALPIGTEIVSQVNSISNSGLVQLSVTKIVLNKNGKVTELNVPAAAITILGNGGKPLIAGKLPDNIVSTNSRSFLVGGIRGINTVIKQLNLNQRRTITKPAQNGRPSVTITPDPNVFTEVLEGGTTELVSRLTTSQTGRSPTQTNIWVLQAKTRVEIFVNQSFQL